MSYFSDLEKHGTFHVRNSVLRGKGTEVFKTLKAGMNEADKYSSEDIQTRLEKEFPLPFMKT